MASNKNQHFVPRCHLRQFTIDSANKAINLYNIDHDRFIEGASVKHQCSGNYFYGEDGQLEKAFQTLEIEYSNILRAIREPNYRLTDKHRRGLKLFWFCQHLRTEAASRRAVEMTSAMADIVDPSASEFRLSIREAVIMAMRVFADEMDAINDMKVCLIKNRSEIPFVTSDNPAILTNRWSLQNKTVRGLSLGLKTSGNLFILPLSPQLLCLAYDGDVYSIPHKHGWVDSKANDDADAFNQHQYLNCHANVYIRDSSTFHLIREAYLSVSANRPACRHRLNYAIKDTNDGVYTRYKVVDPEEAGLHDEAIIHTQNIYPIPKAWPRIIRWRRNACVYTNGTGVGYVRKAFTHDPKTRPFRKEKAFKQSA